MDEHNLLQSAIKYHGPMLSQVLADLPVNTTSEEEMHRLKMCKFIVKKRRSIFKPISKERKILTKESSIRTVPLEMFCSFDKQARRRHFFNTLTLGSVLIGQIMNVKCSGFYKLLVLCKHGEYRKLEDLSLVVFLNKKEIEDEDGKEKDNEFNLQDILRVVVCNVDIMRRMIIVSLNEVRGKELPKEIELGRVKKSELPFYIGISFGNQSLVDVLHNTPSFYKPTWAKDLKAELNIDRHRMYSLYENLDGIEIPKETCALELRKRQNHTFSEKFHRIGTQCFLEGKKKEAFENFKKALECDPSNVDVYVSRGIAHANEKNLGNAIVDLEAALKINKAHSEAGRTLSELLVIAAKTHKEQNNIEAAKLTLELALGYNSSNEDALNALFEISREETSSKAKKSASVKNLEKDLKKTSISELQKQKEMLQERLLHETNSPLSSPSQEYQKDSGSNSPSDEHKRKCDQFLRAIRESTDKMLPSSKRKHRSRNYYEHDDRIYHRGHRSHRPSDRGSPPDRRPPSRQSADRRSPSRRSADRRSPSRRSADRRSPDRRSPDNRPYRYQSRSKSPTPSKSPSRRY